MAAVRSAGEATKGTARVEPHTIAAPDVRDHLVTLDYKTSLSRSSRVRSPHSTHETELVEAITRTWDWIRTLTDNVEREVWKG
jgi:hypothetical protein